MFTNRNRSFSKALQQGTAMTLISMMALSGVAVAQDAIVSSSQAGAPVAAATDDDIQEVVVVGARAAQQSANDRKRRAKTAVDSIVADDVGAFPDKNLNEALSRVAGVALERDEYGDGAFITIRGNSPENIRVEMDGLGVGGGGMGATRSAELTTLPSDLIKSVDVIKGSTADMTEGGIGGSVRVQTRTGLDFAKPYFSFRVGQRHNSLGQKWQPDFNIVASRKFLDNRLGVIFSLTSTKLQNTTNGVENNQSGAGYLGRIDFDNSPEKTFTFNPDTVWSPEGETRPTLGADALLANSSFTPRQLVEMSAAAQTKADCSAAFPLLTPGTGVNQSNTPARRNQRAFELQNCLNQWNDLLPSLPRTFDHTQYEDRFSADIRFDYRINDRLTVFAKYQQNERKVDRYFRERRLGGGGGTAGMVFNPGVQYNAVTNPVGVWYMENPGTDDQQRRVAPGNTDYFRYETVGAFGNRIAYGDILPIDPASVQVDENHFVTEYIANDQFMSIGERWEPFTWETNFMQAGGTYRGENLLVEFMAGKSATDYSRKGTYSNRGINYGSGRFFIQPSGLWATEILTPYDETDPANYVQMNPQASSLEFLSNHNSPNYYAPAYTSAQRPLVSGNVAVEHNGWLSETEETTAKIDATYEFREKIPFFTTFKAGLSSREYTGSFWSNPGGKVIRSQSGDVYMMQPDPNYTGTGTAPMVPVRDSSGLPVRNPDYVPAVVLPRAFIRSSIRACQPTATSIEPCNFGFVGDHIQQEARDGVLTISEAELIQLMATTFKQPESEFFNDYEGAEALENWRSVDARRITNLMPNANMDCMKTCVASDGKVYEQPFSSVSEKVTAAYYMAEFEQELPFDVLINGNFGLRVVETEVTGTGNLTLNYDKVNASYDPAFPDAAIGVTRTVVNQTTSISQTTRDYMPSYNLNVWAIPDQLVVRYYKGKNVARPAIGDLLPNGTCDIDERTSLGAEGYDDDTGCGRIGNPGLKPLTAWNQNLSVEWYPNRDTMISFAKFKQDERIGGRLGTTVSSYLLAGTGTVDPVTGESLDDVLFSVPTWTNAPGYVRDGWEFSSKTAFTFLPWRFRYLGADFNYSEVESKLKGAIGSAVVDPNTGEVMPPYNEPRYFANLSLWYDDGTTNARISAQSKSEIFNAIEGNAGNVRNNYPFPGGTNSRPVVYNPGNPTFTEKTLYIDAKITHKLTPNVEIFAEGRNLSKEARVSSTNGRRSFADGTPYINGLFYGGRSFSFGLTYRMQ